MDAHPDFHLIFTNSESGLAGHRNSARRESHTHGADIGQSFLCDSYDLVQRASPIRFGPGNLKGKYHTRDAPAAVRFGGWSRRHIISDQDRAHLNVFHIGHFCSHVEIHDIATIVAVDIDYTLTPMNALSDPQHLLCAGG